MDKTQWKALLYVALVVIACLMITMYLMCHVENQNKNCECESLKRDLVRLGNAAEKCMETRAEIDCLWKNCVNKYIYLDDLFSECVRDYDECLWRDE